MLNSRDISRLRADVAINCRKFVEIAARDGWPVLVTGTVRDDEYQQYCYENGTGGKPPATFHSVKAGLAFDICKNVKGQEYSDTAFWEYCGALGQKMGFEWGGTWTSFRDKPHFQWSEHGKYTGASIRAGKYPPEMPQYEEDDDMDIDKLLETMTDEQAYKLLQKAQNHAETLNLPDWGNGEPAGELSAAITAGITSGKSPMRLCTRYETAIMAKRAEEGAKK